VKPVEIQTKKEERTKLNIDQPAPLKVRPIDWVVVTPENVEEVFAKLKEKNTDVVLFALTDDGYEALSLTMADIRNYLATQRSIVIKYKEYYEGK
jgi:hypothetical protein